MIYIYSLLFLRYMLQPMRIKFTTLFCFETNIYLRVYPHWQTFVSDQQTKFVNKPYWSLCPGLSSPCINLEMPANSARPVTKTRVWLIVAGRGSWVQSRGRASNVAVAGPKSRSRVQSRGRGSNVAVAGPKSRSRVQCRGRRKWFGVRGNWVKTSDMKKI